MSLTGMGNLGGGMYGMFNNNLGDAGVAGAGQRYGTRDVQAERDLVKFGQQKKLQDDQLNQQAMLQRGSDTAANQRAQLSYNAGTLPALLQQDRFNAVFPGLMGQFNNQSERVGGSNAPLPEITVGPVYTPQQTQEQVNKGRATNDQQTQQTQLRTQQELAGKGFGATSPLLAALQSQQGMAGMQANSELERGIRFDTAKDNAQQLLSTQQARQGQWAQNEDADIRRRQVAGQQQNALLAALAGLI